MNFFCKLFSPLSLVLLASLPIAAAGDERLAGIAARSVHLQYAAASGVAFYNEVTVEQSAVGTYFCACGWNGGYFGIQELADGKKVVLFSVWDAGAQNDPNSVPEERRVRLLHQGHGVRVGRFGNEGTGGQSFLDFDWQIGATYRFLVTATVEANRTAYAGWFAPSTGDGEPSTGDGEPSTGDDEPAAGDGKPAAWRHLVTFSTPNGGKPLRGYYSFVEDFRRNRLSAAQTRAAAFGPGWVQNAAGNWQPLTAAQFSADANPATNIDAAAAAGRFLLKTGGDVQNTHTALGGRMTLEGPPDTPPRGSRTVKPRYCEAVLLRWRNAASAPAPWGGFAS